jgi:alpha,alpha-trehalase
MTPARRAEKCKSLAQIRQFIRNAWGTLRRSGETLVKSSIDPKIDHDEDVLVYLPRDMPVDPVKDQFRQQLSPAEFEKVRVLSLPPSGEPARHGLLYLPYPYVVPGGRFNEMYGWDSYFILLGLLEDGHLELAKGMTDNLIFEVEHYGKVLNANRTYYLNRSQPPFLSEMVLEIYKRIQDREWLRNALHALHDYYRYWTSQPHLTPTTGLSRYEGGADTPAPEVLVSERDIHGRNDYDRIQRYFHDHKVHAYDVSRFYERSIGQLTPLFYRADRAMRESGFDPSSRFGPFSAAILDYNPVDLNCLLYQMESEISSIHRGLNQEHDANEWDERARNRSEAINRLMWDEKAGMYFDYDFRNGRRSGYPFLTTFYPLWTGIASPAQANNVVRNLAVFERPGGLQTSTQRSGDQWDAPFGWAPLHLIAVQGLRRYGFQDGAERISVKFLSMVIEDFSKTNTIREKYDVVTRRSDLRSGLKFGYSSNEVGFGWTNGVFDVLYTGLSPNSQEQLHRSCPD